MRRIAIGPSQFKVTANASKSYKHSTTAKVRLSLDKNDTVAEGEIDAREASAIGKWFLELSENIRKKK